MLTFDDGCKSHFTVVRPVLDEQTIQSGGTLDNYRRPKDDADLRYWLQNRVWHHRFTPAEIRAASGLTMEQVTEALRRCDIRPGTKPQRAPDAPLPVLPKRSPPG